MKRLQVHLRVVAKAQSMRTWPGLDLLVVTEHLASLVSWGHEELRSPSVTFRLAIHVWYLPSPPQPPGIGKVTEARTGQVRTTEITTTQAWLTPGTRSASGLHNVFPGVPAVFKASYFLWHGKTPRDFG